MKDGYIKAAAATPEIRVADCQYNRGQILKLIEEAYEKQVKLLVLPELCITGYTCGDLFFQPALLEGAWEALEGVAEGTRYLNMLVVAGLPVAVKGKIYNCGAVCYNGEILGLVPKTHLPNYGEFYEKRQFTPAPEETEPVVMGKRKIPFGTDILFCCEELKELVVAVEICEDLWAVDPPSVRHAKAGAMVVCNLSASDETIGKEGYRRSLVASQSARLVCGYLYGDAGQGESTTDMVFAGHNLIGENGVILAENEKFTDEMVVTEIDVQRLASERRRLTIYPEADNCGYMLVGFSIPLEETQLSRHVSSKPFIPGNEALREETCEDILSIQAMGLKKRMDHSRAETAVIGISGGLDSTLALLVVVRAMDGLKRSRKEILAVTMPSFGTTVRTRGNAEILCQELGVELRSVDIKAAVNQHFQDIGQDGEMFDVTYENVQARERTQVLMDITNLTRGMVVGTGDLSELALGWATYNGDHMSMYGVNASIPKTLVRYLVAHEAAKTKEEKLKKVLLDILDTPISPELLPPEEGEISQKTEDLVGPYELHDFFLYYGIRWAFRPRKVYRMALYAFGDVYDGECILKWLKVFYRRFFSQQFKRSCLPDGPKVGSVSLSPRGDWRMPSDASAELWLEELE